MGGTTTRQFIFESTKEISIEVINFKFQNAIERIGFCFQPFRVTPT
jgi:hypothetical protein